MAASVAPLTRAAQGPGSPTFPAGTERVCVEWAWAPAEDGSVLRGLDVYRVRGGLIVTKDVYGKITAPA
ncbi:hypothetical protein V6U81_00015 [Micromonospora sp. CPCC 205711]|uniref:hypothetical protein n=1 Tax=Micromonospora sp. CPCC 205547 TaxID=3122400 RepID=UPI002FF23B9A